MSFYRLQTMLLVIVGGKQKSGASAGTQKTQGKKGGSTVGQQVCPLPSDAVNHTRTRVHIAQHTIIY